MVLASLEWGLSHTKTQRHEGLSPVSWVRRSRSQGDLRVLRQGLLIEQARSLSLWSHTFVNGFVLLLADNKYSHFEDEILKASGNGVSLFSSLPTFLPSLRHTVPPSLRLLMCLNQRDNLFVEHRPCIRAQGVYLAVHGFVFAVGEGRFCVPVGLGFRRTVSGF